MKEKLLKIKNTLKRHRRAVRNTIIASVLVVCTLINCFWYDVQKAYAAAIPVGIVASDVVLGLIATCGALSGIVTHTDTSVNLDELTEEEKNTYAAEVNVSNRELYKMLYDEGYFEGTGLEDVVHDSIYESDATTALQKFINKTGTNDKTFLMHFNNKEPDKKDMGIAASAAFLLAVKKCVTQAWQKFVTKCKADAAASAGGGGGNTAASLDLPDAMPEQPEDCPYYLVLYQNNTANFYWMKNPEFKFGQSRVKDKLDYIILSAEKSYKYAVSEGEWVLTDGVVNDWYAASGNPTNEKDATTAIENLIPYHNFTLQADFNTLYGSYKIWGVAIEPEGYKGRTITPEEAAALVNKTLKNSGFKTRYTPIDFGVDDVYDKKNTNIDDVPCEPIILSPDAIENTKNILAPIDNVLSGVVAGVTTVADAFDRVVEGIETGSNSIAAANTAAIPADEKGKATGKPFSPNWGPMINYETKGLEDVFPFCVPFDIARCIQVLCADPEAPRWEFPFEFERWGIHETIVLDMSRFESVAKISRWIETLIFTYVLASKTKQFMFA